MVCAFRLFAQQQTVKGILTELDGNPIPSATVLSKTGGASAVTDENGRFTISVPGNAILTFTSVGF